MATTVQETGVYGALMDKMNPKKTDTKKSAVDETQDRFMTLLVTQMRNQDPMNPLDNAQVTSQFAQLSTVTGIDKLNDTLASLMSNYQLSQSLQSASMIGHGVLAPGSGLDLTDGVAMMGVEFTEPADRVQVTIHDSTGKMVRAIDLGEQKIGSVPLAWDGKTDTGEAAADGHYTFKVAATRSDKTVPATALQFGLVSTVSTGTDGNGVKLNIQGLGAVDFSNVRQIL